MSRWVWTDEASEGWCGDHETREAAIEEGRLATGESFEVAEVAEIPPDDGTPMTFLRVEQVAAPTGSKE